MITEGLGTMHLNHLADMGKLNDQHLMGSYIMHQNIQEKKKLGNKATDCNQCTGETGHDGNSPD